MLYDNAQILDLLALAAADAPDPVFAERAAETVGWLVRDMTAQTVSGRAAFAASEDADSEGEEGRFYIWSEPEVDALLGAEAAAFKRAYDVTAAGNWEGRTILRRVIPPGSSAEEAALARSRAVLMAARSQRVRPGRDDKVLADWNALAVAALCRAGAVFARPDWLGLAATAYDFVRTEMMTADGRVLHAWRQGQVTAPGMLDDQASMARAAMALFEATGVPERLEQAIGHANAALAFYRDEDGSFFMTASDAADVPGLRPRLAADNATPAGNGLMAEVFARLFHQTGDAAWRGHAEALLAAFSGEERMLASMPTLLAAAYLLENATTVVIAGDADSPAAAALAHVALAAPNPAICVLRTPDTRRLTPSHPAYGKPAGGEPAAYVCRGNVCGLPVRSAAALREALG